jgi:NodT family efflux transporter outer membrane factor (OMF) lipoprotein
MSVAEARQAQLELQNNIVRVYIELSLHYAQRDIVEATLKQQQQILDLAQKRLDGGIGTHFEVSQAETPLPETHRQIDALDEEIALSRNQLSALAGKGPGEGAQLQRPTLSLGAALKLPSSLPAQLLGQRPDVVASRWQVAAQARGIDVAHAGFYPNVDLVGSLGYMATGGGMLEFLTGKKLNYTVGPAISLPIFDGGRLRAELGEASAGYDIAVAHYNQTLVNALKNISDQLIRRESMDKQQVFRRRVGGYRAEDLRHRDDRLSAWAYRLPQRAQCTDAVVQAAASAAAGAGGTFECACRTGDGTGRWTGCR